MIQKVKAFLTTYWPYIIWATASWLVRSIAGFSFFTWQGLAVFALMVVALVCGMIATPNRTQYKKTKNGGIR